MVLLSHLFQPPKQRDEKSWEIVRHLVDHGFSYDHVRETVETDKGKVGAWGNYVAYPTTLKEAKEFVETFKSQSHLKETRL